MFMDLSRCILSNLLNIDWGIPKIFQMNHFWIQLIIFSMTSSFFLNDLFVGFLIPKEKLKSHAKILSRPFSSQRIEQVLPMTDSSLLFVKPIHFFLLHINPIFYQLSCKLLHSLLLLVLLFPSCLFSPLPPNWFL